RSQNGRVAAGFSGRYHSQVLRAAVIRPEPPICKPRPVQALSAIFGRGPRGTTEPTLRSARRLAACAERSRDRKHAPATTYDEGHPMANKGILGRKLGMTQVFDADNRI